MRESGNAYEYLPDPNETEKFGPTLLRKLDENPGEEIIDKGIFYGKYGANIGIKIYSVV